MNEKDEIQKPDLEKNLNKTSSKAGFIVFEFVETILMVVISLLIVLAVRKYLIQPFLVKGASMEPNFNDGNYLIVDELSYRLRGPERGEVIVFKYPRDTSQYFIKRIIGLPSEKIEIKNHVIKIYNTQYPQGKELDEQYISKDDITNGNLTYQLGPNEYFVLGDNRNASSDSRIWGPVPQNDIVGRTWIRAWPLDKLSLYSAPSVN